MTVWVQLKGTVSRVEKTRKFHTEEGNFISNMAQNKLEVSSYNTQRHLKCCHRRHLNGRLAYKRLINSPFYDFNGPLLIFYWLSQSIHSLAALQCTKSYSCWSHLLTLSSSSSSSVKNECNCTHKGFQLATLTLLLSSRFSTSTSWSRPPDLVWTVKNIDGGSGGRMKFKSNGVAVPWCSNVWHVLCCY